MGMADQYDDGRYDPVMADEHGFAHTSIGYVPITARRGGIKYPKKGTTVALTNKNRLRKLEAELDANLDLQKVLRGEELALRADIKRVDIPAEPSREIYGDKFSVDVRFSTQGATYTYLLMRSGNRWFTTGKQEEQKVFASWPKLCEWLNGTAWHSKLHVLREVLANEVATSYEQELDL